VRFCKKVYNTTYIHISLINDLYDPLKSFSQKALDLIYPELLSVINVLKFSDNGDFVSALNYPNFFDEPFPCLFESWSIDLNTSEVIYRTYKDSLNPPILHRKELLLDKEHPEISKYCELTKIAESLGLFEETSKIGFKNQWLNLINEKGYRLEGYNFIPIANVEDNLSENDLIYTACEETNTSSKNVERHRTALNRYNFSAPIQALMRFGYLDGQYKVFDYGCGHGDDVRGLIENNITATGWDPFFATNEKLVEAELVNLGFVINVIEDLDERIEALEGAYFLADKLLVIGVMLPNQKTIGGFFLRPSIF